MPNVIGNKDDIEEMKDTVEPLQQIPGTPAGKEKVNLFQITSPNLFAKVSSGLALKQSNLN